MKRNNFFSRFIVVTLLSALLLMSGSRAIRVSALAELAPEVAPVFDTQIYQLQDYIDHGGMTDPQLDIFYMLCGFYALGQAGSEDYKLTNPYTSQSGVLNWLKDVGIETYNTLIGLAPGTIQLPDGSIMSTDIPKKALSVYVANLMGCALKAVDYDTVQEFVDDIDNSTNFYIPWNKSTQYGLNTMFQLYGGIYNWQFDTDPFTSNFTWKTIQSTGTHSGTYNNYLNTLSDPISKANTTVGTWYNQQISLSNYTDYHILFYNTVSHDWSIHKTSSDYLPLTVYFPIVYYYSQNGPSLAQGAAKNNSYGISGFSGRISQSVVDSYSTIQQIIQYIFDNSYIPLENLVDHVYVGDSWANRNEIFNVQNLNFDDTGTDFYVTPADDDNYLLDIKGILQDILNDIDLYGIFIDNLFSVDGVPVHDTDLIRITTDIYDLLNQQNPPIPVNLNDISELTDNTYLERVKEHARNAGDIFANYVAFWHNCDSDLVYTVFGAAILVLVGAFVGKWGHS